MTDYEFEQLLRADGKEFSIEGAFAPLSSTQRAASKHKHRFAVGFKYGLIVSFSLLLAGVLIYGVLDKKSNTAATTATVPDALSNSMVMKMVKYASSYPVDFPFTVYIPVGGLGASDYTVNAEQGLPLGVEFDLSSNERQNFMTIEEYSSSKQLPANRHPWVKVTSPVTGQIYWKRAIANGVVDYYFTKGSTTIMVQETSGYTKLYFPKKLFNGLKPLSYFSTNNLSLAKSVSSNPTT